MKKSNPSQLKAIGIFLTITFSLSSIFYFLIIHSGTLGGGSGHYVMGLMWCPGISALLTYKILKRNISDLGWQWGKTKYQLQSYLIPLGYASIAYAIIWSFGLGGFYDETTVHKITDFLGLGPIGDGWSIVIYALLVSVFGIFRSMSSALGEEIGWRGFLTPELYKTQGFTTTSLITGLIWGIWHLPILLFADYNSGTPYWFSLPCFMVLVISISFIYTWYRIKSGSLWTAVILHGSHNLFIQSVFTPLTENTGDTAYFIDEFGIVLPIIAFGFAIYFWTRRNELEPVPHEV